jgi:hypothetical protein
MQTSARVGRGQTCRRRAEKRRTLGAHVIRLTPFRFGEPKAGEMAKTLRRASEWPVLQTPRQITDSRARRSQPEVHTRENGDGGFTVRGFSMNDGIE